ncbi:squalene/phytoene synthase family protein [Acetobacteraceae bacterium KSS8]|uniref:Squalene/phytoene synthase family protein n=1 Tax=Endosaccharibacter trunci TaxID=2812733 RepID=A0ABT1W5U5_9PROT|nr:squalene/phytoene synthase family protein [Acetobacteraceae bacterium KSS8]
MSGVAPALPASIRPDESAVDAAPADLAVLSRHGRSFRLAGRLMGRDSFARAAALYAACRAVDDLADEAPDPVSARESLQAIERDLTGQGPRTVLGSRFRQLGVCRDSAAGLVRAMLSDLEPVRIADEAALLRYAAGAAGTVGVMMCDLLGIRDRTARSRAGSLGIAMQLTNIARDVAEDAARDRIYLPAAWLPPGCAPDTLLQDPVAVFRAVRTLLALAENHYAIGARGYPALPPQARLSIPVAASLYRRIGQTILGRGASYLAEPRTVVSGPVRARVVLCTVFSEWRSGIGPGRR